MARSRKSVGCPVEVTLRLIGARWKVMVLYHLLDGVKRFNELHRLLTGIAPRTLTKVLRELERDGLITRKAYLEVPPKVEYALTPLGKSLQPLLLAMDDWGEQYSHRKPDRR